MRCVTTARTMFGANCINRRGKCDRREGSSSGCSLWSVADGPNYRTVNVVGADGSKQCSMLGMVRLESGQQRCSGSNRDDLFVAESIEEHSVHHHHWS